MATEIHDAPHARWLEAKIAEITPAWQAKFPGEVDRLRSMLMDYRNTWHQRNHLEQQLQLQHKRTDLVAAALPGLVRHWFESLVSDAQRMPHATRQDLEAGTAAEVAQAAVKIADAALDVLRDSEPKRRRVGQVDEHEPAEKLARGRGVELQRLGDWLNAHPDAWAGLAGSPVDIVLELLAARSSPVGSQQLKRLTLWFVEHPEVARLASGPGLQARFREHSPSGTGLAPEVGTVDMALEVLEIVAALVRSREQIADLDRINQRARGLL